MTRWAWMVCAVLVSTLVTAIPALADQVTLRNGDVLHGEVKEQGGRIKIQHAILGEIDVAKADVAWITKEGETPPAAVPPTSLADRCCCTQAKKDEVEKCPSPWDFAVGFSISNEAGNTEKFGLNADLEAGYTWGINSLHWRVVGFYEEASGAQTEGKYFSNLRYRRRVSPRGSLFGLYLVDRDDFADIQLRQGWFVGYDRQFYKSERTTFHAGLGAGGIIESRKSYETIYTAAAIAYAEYKHTFESGDSFRAYGYIIPYLDYTERSPMRLELQYAHPLREHFDLTAGLLVDYVHEPPGDIESLDTKITFGIRWKP